LEAGVKRIGRLLGIIIAISLLVAGWSFHPKALATVPGVNSSASINSSGTASGNGSSQQTMLSADGRFIMFESTANNLVSSDTNNSEDVFVRDVSNNSTSRISISTAGTQANSDSLADAISRTGRYVLFDSFATNLISGTTTSGQQLFLRDTVAGTTTLLSKSSSGTLGNAASIGRGVSSDGRFVLFLSAATNLGPVVTNSGQNLYMLDRSTGSFTILNKKYDGTLPDTTNQKPYARMSCDGAFVVFESSPQLTTSSTSHTDIYLLDRRSGDTLTDLTAFASAAAFSPSISCSGGYVGLASSATNLDTSVSVPAGYYHAYEYDRVNNTYNVVDQPYSGSFQSVNIASLSTLEASEPIMAESDNGVVSFESSATNLTSAGTSGIQDIFLRDTGSGVTELLSRDSGGNEGNNSSDWPTIDSAGRLAGYRSFASNLVTNDTNSASDVFASETGY
jgi:hypothetical protein